MVAIALHERDRGTQEGFRMVAMDHHESSDVGARRYLHVVRRRKWVVVVAMLVVVATAVGVSLAQTPVYDAHADLLIKEPATIGSGSVFNQPNQCQTDVSVLVGTQIQIVTSRPIKNAVTQKVGGLPRVVVTEVGQTDVIRVTSSSTSPQRASAVANAWANAYIDFTRTQDIDSSVAAVTQIQLKVDDLQKQIDKIDAQVAAAAPANKPLAVANLNPQRDNLVTQQGVFKQRLGQLQVDASLKTGAAELITAAEPPTSPSSPKPARNGVLAVFVGLFLGIGLAFLLDHFDDSVSSTEEVERATHGLSSLAHIPLVTSWKTKEQPQVISIDDPNSAAAEAYRTLRTSIQFAGLDRANRIIQMTSPNAQEGKTTTLANLGVALANAGQRVCICCCDLRRPRVHEFFGLENALGLTSVILGGQSLSAAVQAVPEVDGLFLLASGPQPPNPSELLASPRAAEVLRALASRYDIVLVDSPPILPVTDGAVIAGFVDATVLTVAAGATTRREISRTMQILEQVHAPMIGFVFNGVSGSTGGTYYRYRQYNYYSSSPTRPEPRSEPTPEQTTRHEDITAGQGVETSA